MTATIPHRLIYNDDTFSIVGIDGENLFHPANYGIKTIPTTACAGFDCTYALIEDSLRLLEVYLRLDKEDEKLIQQGKGIRLFSKIPSRYIERDAKGKKFISWDFRCDHLNELVQFTGGILIGSDSVRGMFTARGLPLPYTFHKVYELIFDSGQLIEIVDCSQKMSKFRDILTNPERCQEIDLTLEQCFSFYYSR